MARHEPAAVRSRIQSPSLISQVTIEPATGLPCATDAAIARTSRKSTLRRRSRLHTRHARRAIGTAFHSISGMLRATTNGLVVNAMASDSVGKASGDSAENSPGTSDLVGGTLEFLVSDCRAGNCNALAGERLTSSALPFDAAATAAMSFKLARRSFARTPCRNGSRAASYSTTRLAHAMLSRAVLIPA